MDLGGKWVVLKSALSVMVGLLERNEFLRSDINNLSDSDKLRVFLGLPTFIEYYLKCQN